MDYQTIYKIKESEKATVELAAVELYVGPVIVKKLKGGKPDIYRLLAMQKNTYIPQIYAVEETEEGLIVAEEYVDGESLSEHLQKNLLSDEKKINLALQLCEAVGFLHALKPAVIHRDIKPSNILITGKGELKLIDFDASRRYNEAPSSSDTRLMGTVEYAPPEQFGYSQTDMRSDIYSMGVVFHEMRPTENKKLEELWEKIAEKCTSFDPKNRYQSVAELKRELEKLVAWKKKRRKRWLAGIAAIIVLIAAGAVGIASCSKQNQTEQTDGTVPTGTPTGTSAPAEPTAGTTLTPSPEPTPTLTPEPSPEPTLTPTPIPEPTEEVQAEKEEAIENILTELSYWDAYIDTFYKDLDTSADYMQYSDWYAGKDVQFTNILVRDMVTERYFSVPQEYFYGENNVLHIKREYMKEWEAGIYALDIFYVDYADGRKGDMETHLQVFDGVDVSGDAFLFDNNYLMFYYEYTDKVHTILSNDIVGAFKDIGTYRVLENGRVAEFDKEFLFQLIQPGTDGILKLVLTLEDGRKGTLTLEYITGKPSYAE